jgi:hypothetical protein
VSVATHPLRPELPPLPPKMRQLPVDHRGYPVPFFVEWVGGVPDHRLQDPTKLARCVREKRCWLCGDRLGRYLVFVIGPMCAVNRVSSEPPSHRECAEYAVSACPFLTRPHAQRREAGMLEEAQEVAGVMIKRNPGVVLLWVTRSYRLARVANGVLFDVGDPVETHWYSEGRAATRAEVLAAIESGLPLLEEQARQDRPGALEALQQMLQRALRLVPKEEPAHA